MKIHNAFMEMLVDQIKAGNGPAIMLIVRRHFDVNHKVRGETPLHVAVKLGSVDITQYLLEHDADPNLRDAGGKTSMHYAMMQENVDVAAALYGFGGDVLALDDNGKTPVDMLPPEKTVAFLAQMAKLRIASQATIDMKKRCNPQILGMNCVPRLSR